MWNALLNAIQDDINLDSDCGKFYKDEVPTVKYIRCINDGTDVEMCINGTTKAINIVKCRFSKRLSGYRIKEFTDLGTEVMATLALPKAYINHRNMIWVLDNIKNKLVNAASYAYKLKL